MITIQNVAEILAGSRSLTLQENSTLDEPFVLDSFTLVALQSTLEEKHGVVFEPSWDEIQDLNTVANIHQYLGARFPDKVSL